MNFAEKEEFKAGLVAGFDEWVTKLMSEGMTDGQAHRIVTMFIDERAEEYGYRAKMEHQISRLWAIVTMMTIFLVGILIVSAFNN